MSILNLTNLDLGSESRLRALSHTQTMNKYKLVSNDNENNSIELESQTFQTSVEEALNRLGWYVIDDGERFVGVDERDPNNTIELKDITFEDAQYELILQTKYYISSTPL